MAERRIARRRGGFVALLLWSLWAGCAHAADLPMRAPWLAQGDAAAAQTVATGVTDHAVLRHAGSAGYRVTSYRVIEGLEPGSYTLRARVRSSGGQASCFVFGRVEGDSLARTHVMASSEWQEIVVPGIPAAGGTLSVGLHSTAAGGQWAEMDDVRIERDAVARPFLSGGDVSLLPLLEQHHVVYTDRQGRPKDALQILKDSGQSIVRLRLYEQPGSGRGADGYYWPAGSMDLPDVLAMARRAAALGLRIELTLHYSDFWTNSKTQNMPAAWAAQLDRLPDEAARFERLRGLVAERTTAVLRAMQAQGTPPQFVSIGNEIEGGLLYPYGRATDANWPRLARLLEAGSDAVKAVAPSTRVILHLDDAGNMEKYIHYFDQARALGVHWDVIGTSYYPFWSRRGVPEVVDFCNRISARYDTDIMVMETGFNWTPALPNGDAGQLSDNGPYPASMSTPEGQRAFIDTLFNGLKRVDGSRAIGVLYWDPIMIPARGVGWALREGSDAPGANVVANATLFDFNGHALPVLDVWRDHAAALPLDRHPAAAPASASSAGERSTP